MSLGPGEILVVLVVALLVLGPDKLPEAARAAARFYKEIRNLSSSVRSQVEDALEINDHSPLRNNGIRDDAPPAPSNPQNPDVSGFKLVDDKPNPAWTSNEGLDVDTSAPPKEDP